MGRRDRRRLAGVAEDLALTAGIEPDLIQVVYNPIVTPELRRMAAKRIGHAWFEPGEPPVFLAVGRLAPQKDFPTLIRAFAQVRARHEARLLILGGGPDARISSRWSASSASTRTSGCRDG